MSTRAREDSFLTRIVSTVSSSLELDEVLSAVVRLLTDASAVHACFVYLLEDDGARLVLRAASEPYAGFAGRIELPRGEGRESEACEVRRCAGSAGVAADGGHGRVFAVLARRLDHAALPNGFHRGSLA